MVIFLPVFEEEKYALEIATIKRHTVGQVAGESGEDILSIENEVGNLFITQAVKDEKQPTVLTDMDLGYDQLKVIGGKDKAYIVLELDCSNWTYRLEVDSSAIGAMTRNPRIGLVVVSLALVGLIGLPSYLLSGKFVHPISRTQERLNLESEGFSGRELDLVIQSASRIIGEKEALSAYLVTQRPQLEVLFVLSLLRNRVEGRELDQQLWRFDCSSQDDCYCTASVRTDLLEDSHGGERDSLLLAINNMITETVPKENRILPVVSNEEMRTTTYRMDKDDAEASRKVMEHRRLIQKCVKEYLNSATSTSVSNRLETLNESKQSVDRTKEVLYYRVNTGPSSIIFYREIVLAAHEKTLIRYPIEEQSRLFETIRFGNQEVKNLVHELIDTSSVQNKNPLGWEVVSVRLINELVQLRQLLGIDSKNSDNMRRIYVKVLNDYHPKKLGKLALKQLVLPTTERSRTITDHESKNLSENTMYIVCAEYGRGLSLDVIVDRLHYNPSCLSNVSEEETGEKFGDFVQSHRLEVIEKWLRETNLSVKEIAERLQYRNPQNFIRFFRKKESITPGEYRRKYL